MVVFSETEDKLNISQIEEIERWIGLCFPNDYKEHLLKYNGGRCEPNIFSFNENGKITESCINRFLAIYNGEYDNLKTDIDILKIQEKRLPTHILPIANDPLGNCICISCAGNDIGKVYFWDHEKEVDYSISADSDYSNLYLIAGTFNEFISELKEEINYP